MRSCLFLFGLLGATFAQLTVSAQNVIPNTRAPAAPAAVPIAPPTSSGVGQSIPAGTKIWAGDEISVLIKEDQEPAWKLIVSDQGMVDIGAMGAVAVTGRNSSEAAAAISSYLERDYYHKATVQVQIIKKALGSVPTFKVMMDGKLGRPGPLRFTEAEPLTLSEAVTMAMPTEWANPKKVQLTRGNQISEHNVEAIIKGGQVGQDVRLKDGDRIYVPKRGWKPGE